MEDMYIPYLNWIETQKDKLLERVFRWASINSYTLNPQGLDELLSILLKEFSSLGGNVEIIPLSPLTTLDKNGQFSSTPLGKALRLSKRKEAPVQVLLCGHMDTVYPPTLPFEISKKEDMWIGPGVADMKGGLAILLTVLEAFEQFPLNSSIGWEVLITPDEEIGSPSSRMLYEKAAARHSLGLIFEPALPDGTFVRERKGSVNFTLCIEGKEAHAGRDFNKGRNPVFPLARFIQQVESLLGKEDLIINIADLYSKGPVNIIPACASCKINLRSSSIEILKHVSQQIEKWANELHNGDIKTHILKDSFRNPKPFDSYTQHVFHAYENCALDLGIPFNTCPTGGVCDGNILGNAGLPTLDTAGVIGGALHTQKEYMVLSSLVERAKLTALFLYKLASGKFNNLVM